MLRKITLAGVLALALILGPAATASAGIWDDPDCSGSTCSWTGIEAPEVDDLTGANIGFTAGPTECIDSETEEEVDCSTGDNWWSNDKQCYVELARDDGGGTPPGADPNGAWYSCTSLGGDSYVFWSDTPPPGITQLSPEQAARMLIASFTLQAPPVSMAPNAGPAVIGVPVWAWVEDPAPLQWGPYTETATLGGVTVTATAQATHTLWDMGDGGQMVCNSVGTAYSPSLFPAGTPLIEQVSPSGCSYAYRTLPEGGSSGMSWSATGTTYWQVDWSAEGQSGTISLSAPAVSCTIPIVELQSVNVPTPTGATPSQPLIDDDRVVTCT